MMKYLAKPIQAIAFLLLASLPQLRGAVAQTNYENYTFTTLAGPPESGVGWHDGTGSAAQFNHPSGVALDTNGNVYVADANNHTIRKIKPGGMVTTLAGLAGSVGSANGPGSAARFNFPDRAAVDGSGNLYVADTVNHTIRKITPDGAVTTFAGTAGSPGTKNGTGSAARFNSPYGVAFDRGGNLYVADTGNHAIRKITPGGVVTTLAGLPGTFGTNDGVGSLARFYEPFGLAVDSSSNVFVADTFNYTIRMITPGGVVTTFAGLAGNQGTNDGTNSDARFYAPNGVTVDGGGNVFVADTYNHTIRMISPAGVVTTLAGSAGHLGSADGTGTAARFYYPFDVAVDSSTNVYVADIYNNSIRMVTPAGVVTTLAGAPTVSGSTNGAGSAARFAGPAGVAVDSSSNVYVADLGNHIIRKITPAGDVTTLAGLAGTAGTNDGVGAGALFNQPGNLAVDDEGNVYVADYGNNTIRTVTPGGSVTTLAGLGGSSGTNDGNGAVARFFSPLGVAVDGNTNVYVADTRNHTIRKISPAGDVTTLAGLAGTSGTNDGAGGAARFSFPEGIVVGDDGNLYVADSGNHAIRKITPAGAVTTLAGFPGQSGNSDGTGRAANFNQPFGIAADSGVNLYVADSKNQTIRKVTPAGVVTTLGGLPGTAGSMDGTGSGGRFNFPEGIAVDNSSNVYVGDASNQTIRKGSPALPDIAVVDLPVAGVGVTRHLDVTNVTTTSWSWSFIRYPGASSAQLSSTTDRNPSFTPDVPDLYLLRMEGRDNSGRVAISVVSVTADTTPRLTLLSTGQGTLSPNFNNVAFQIGKIYTVTAKPAAGYVFNGWTGDIAASSATLTFTMRLNLFLQANFIPNPFGPVVGTYQGLFYDTNNVLPQSSGFFSATVSSSGAMSAKLQSAGASYSLSGQFLGSGVFSNSIPRKNATPLSVQLQLDLAGGNVITGMISNSTWTAQLLANRNIYSKTSAPPQANQKFTLLISGSNDSSAQPGGDSFGTVSVDGSGNVTLSGTLGDTTKLSEKTILSAQGQWPLYAAPYSGTGLVLGWLTLTNELTNDIDGLVTWIKPAQAASKLYPGGFTNQTEAMGSIYRFTNNVPVLNMNTGQVSLVNGNLAANITNQAVLGINNKVTGTNKLSLTITTSSGLFKGSVPDPATGKTISFNGVLLQKQNFGSGFFSGTNQTGRAFFGP